MDNIEIPFVNLSRFFAKHKMKILELTEEIGKSGNYILGDVVENFENDFAAYCGVDYAISVGNGTDAIALSLKALGVGAGDEVIIPPLTVISHIDVVLAQNAIPVFADIDPKTFNMDPKDVEKKNNV